MPKQRESLLIDEPFSTFLTLRGWTVHNIHGNAMQMGLPDKFITHPNYRDRWVEYKVIEANGSIKCTPAQKIVIPKMIADGVLVYAICAPDLRGKHNKKRREHLYKALLDQECNGLSLFQRQMWKHLCPVKENK